jgi:hypothetical protein
VQFREIRPARCRGGKARIVARSARRIARK